MSFFITLIWSCLLSLARAESHTVKFDNRCGYGTPRLIKGNDILTSDSYTVDGVLSTAIAYLHTDDCGFNGERCSLVELSLQNPTCPGCGSSADISLIPPLAFSVPVSFSYFGKCDGQGTSCSSADCNTAFFKPDDTFVQVACQENDANLLITFCGDGGSGSPGTDAGSSSSSSAPSLSSASTPTETVRDEQPDRTASSAPASPTQLAVSPSPSPSVRTSLRCQNNNTKRSTRKMHRRRSHHNLHH